MPAPRPATNIDSYLDDLFNVRPRVATPFRVLTALRPCLGCRVNANHHACAVVCVNCAADLDALRRHAREMRQTAQINAAAAQRVADALTTASTRYARYAESKAAGAHRARCKEVEELAADPTQRDELSAALRAVTNAQRSEAYADDMMMWANELITAMDAALAAPGGRS